MKRPGNLPRILSSLAAASLLVALARPTTAWGADAGTRAKSEAAQASARETKSRAGGQPLVADRLAALAKLWLRVAEAARKAAELERQADAIERETLELEAQARRGRSLVEQTEARRARALGKLQELGLAEEIEKPAAAPAATTVPKSDAAAQSEGAAQ